MEREIFNVKTEPEEDLEYNLHHEEKFEIKSEIDLPIKSEECFKKEQDYQQPEVQDYQQPEYDSRPITFPPIKEELPCQRAPEQGAEGGPARGGVWWLGVVGGGRPVQPCSSDNAAIRPDDVARFTNAKET
uniref:Uncharacterized protein n=1 Tax=Timema genevievae TaxID=629358 RepID=A0A7R9K1Q9_TIMGE|nr:unnamed protein product [Timema genevievae]